MIVKKIKVKVKTNAKKECVEIVNENSLKIFTKASPVDNKANIALQKIIAKYYNISKSSVMIIKGRTSSIKLYEIILDEN